MSRTLESESGQPVVVMASVVILCVLAVSPPGDQECKTTENGSALRFPPFG
jgi:hypothetical protein